MMRALLETAMQLRMNANYTNVIALLQKVIVYYNYYFSFII